MAYTDPVKTWTAGSTLPASDLNTYLRDNLAFLVRPPTCSVFNSTTQSLASSTLTVCTADSENFDNDSMHSTVSNTSRITINTAGRYMFTATGLFASDANGTRLIEFLINGTTRLDGMQVTTAGASQETIVTATRFVQLSVNDYVEVRARHTVAGNLNFTLAAFAATFLGLS